MTQIEDKNFIQLSFRKQLKTTWLLSGGIFLIGCEKLSMCPCFSLGSIIQFYQKLVDEDRVCMCSCPMLGLFGRNMKTMIVHCFCKPYVLSTTQCLQGRKDGSNTGKIRREMQKARGNRDPLSCLFYSFHSPQSGN